MAQKRTYTALQALELFHAMDDCESDGGEELTFAEEEDSDTELHFDEDQMSSTSDEEQQSPPRKKRLEAERNAPAPIVKAKDGTVWETAGVERIQQNTFSTELRFREKAGPTEHAKRRITSRLQSFLCLFTTEMLRTITDCTVHEARRTNASWSLSISELMAFVAVLFLRATLCRVGAMVESWSEKYAVPAIKTTMSRDRYQDIMRYLRFDNKDTRAERVQTDRFAAVSDIWQRFIVNCRQCYTPGQNITVDEQLFPTKVRCPFTQYIATKPDKFGIKFWIAADLETKYLCNAFPYLGRDPSRPKGERVSDSVVMKLMEPFLGKGRTVTMDNFFTSMALANRLLQHNTTLLGTINTVRREIPPPAKNAKGRAEFSTDVYKSGRAPLTVYAPKKNKLVCVLSTMHQQVQVADDRKRKPNTITDYNFMKCGVDIMDQMARVPRQVLGGQWDCLTAGDSCSSDDTCSPRLRTLRQCVAGGGSVKLGPGARNHCENAVTALLASPLHRCQCKRGMKREKNCLSIYWSLKQSVIHGLNLVESYPYEPVEQASDYVRLASIAAESEAGMATVNQCLDAAKACNIDDTCQKLRTEYVSSCIAPSARVGSCNRVRCNKALRKFFDRVPPDYTHELLFCPCSDTACAERRRQTIVPTCSYEEREKPNCLVQLSSCEDDLVCKSRWAQFKHDCQPSELTASGCQHENYGACLIAYTGLIGTTITPNYLDNSTSNVGPWCSCAASGNHRELCNDFIGHFHDNACLKNAILAFGNDTDPKQASNQPGAHSPITNTPYRHAITTTITTTSITIGLDPEQNVYHPQMPTQINERDRLWSDSTIPSPDLSDSSAGCTSLAVPAFLLCLLSLALQF